MLYYDYLVIIVKSKVVKKALVCHPEIFIKNICVFSTVETFALPKADKAGRIFYFREICFGFFRNLVSLHRLFLFLFLPVWFCLQ